MHVVQGSILRKAKSSSPLAIVWIVATLLAPLSARADTVTAVSDALRDILGSGQPPVIDIEAAIGAHQLAGLQAVYAARHDRPIWFDQDGIAAPATALLGRLSGSGLTLGPQVQPLLQDAQARAAAADPHIRAELDLILSALYGVTAGALQHATAPVDFAAALTTFTQTKDQMALVQEPPPPSPPPSPPPASPPLPSPSVAATHPPAAQGQTPPQTATTQAQPANAVPAAASSDLARVGAALDAYRKRSAAGGWPMIPDGPKLQLGDTGPRVDALRARLSATGDLATGVASAAYDAPLVGALQHFQMRHGLKPDGIVGPQTLVTLNVPIDQRTPAEGEGPRLGPALSRRQPRRRRLSLRRRRPRRASRRGPGRRQGRTDADAGRHDRRARAASRLDDSAALCRPHALAEAGRRCELLHQPRHPCHR
jgi:hypothetical protein